LWIRGVEFFKETALKCAQGSCVGQSVQEPCFVICWFLPVSYHLQQMWTYCGFLYTFLLRGPVMAVAGTQLVNSGTRFVVL